jgi:hypothetical protein
MRSDALSLNLSSSSSSAPLLDSCCWAGVHSLSLQFSHPPELICHSKIPKKSEDTSIQPPEYQNLSILSLEVAPVTLLKSEARWMKPFKAMAARQFPA